MNGASQRHILCETQVLDPLSNLVGVYTVLDILWTPWNKSNFIVM